MKKYYRDIAVIAFLLAVFFALSSLAHAAPTLLFSDLTSGPKTGWEGSSTKGAAVTVWGIGFGATRGSNYVTVGGVNLTNASDYAEWGTTGTANGIPRDLERITFWLNSSMSDGAGTISVTVGGTTSATIPFTIRTGSIFFISRLDGSDTYNGQYATHGSGSNGPWRHIRMVDRAYNSLFVPGSIAYVRGNNGAWVNGSGECDGRDGTNWVSVKDASTGTASLPFAVVGYPGEAVTIRTDLGGGCGEFRHTSVSDGVHLAPTHYWNISKFHLFGNNDTSVNGCVQVVAIKGSYGERFIGNWIDSCKKLGSTGYMWVDTTQNDYILGNLFSGLGGANDNLQHNIYIKTQGDVAGSCSPSLCPQYVNNVFIGYNEFANSGSGGSHGGVIEMQTESPSTQTYTQNVHIYNNYFHDNAYEDLSLGGHITDIYVYNNVFANNTCANDAVGMMAYNSFFFNNTFYNEGPTGTNSYLFYQPGDQGIPCPTFKNNIIYARTGQSGVFQCNGLTLVSDHDLFYNISTPTSGGGRTITNAINSNPLFVGSGDYRLQSGSPAKDAGTSTVSGTATIDFLGISRPQNSVYDIGAFEYVSGPPVITASVLYSGSPAGTIDGVTSLQKIVSAGTTTTFTIAANGTSTWLVGGTCGGSLNGGIYTTNAINSDCTVLVTFFQAVTAQVSGGNGSFVCSSPIPNGYPTTCTASPSGGYHTSGISGCGGSWAGGNSYTTDNVVEDCTVTATFVGDTATTRIKHGNGHAKGITGK